MGRNKHQAGRKVVLSINRKTPRALQELLDIRGDAASAKDDFNTYKDIDRTLRLMKKRKASFFVSAVGDGGLAMGRAYDGQILEMVCFKIRSMRSSSDCPTIAPEVCVKYALLLQNIENSRLENMMIDFLHQRSHGVDLHGIRYAWIFGQNGRVFTLRFVRIMKDLSVEDVGPCFEVELEQEFYCGDELWEEALDVQRAKKVRNVEKNAFKDKIGRVHIDRQDLKDIKLKKSRGYKDRAAAKEETEE